MAFALSASLCMPAALGTIAGCGGTTGKISYTSLEEVRVTDPYVVNGMEKEVAYLLSLDEDKLLYHFERNADLTPTAISSYGGGWEGALIGGHTLGHYLTALAQAYANANTEQSAKTQILARIKKITRRLKECQDNAEDAGAHKGFLWGAAAARANPSNPEAQFDFVEQGRTNIATEAWVPWYTMHKIIAGLLSVVEYTGDGVAKEVVTALGDWVCNRTSSWDESTQKAVLRVEYGGMNDCMYALYALTGNEKYAVAAHAFDEEDLFLDALDAPQNYLNGKHANTTIPKILGALNRYITCNGKKIAGEKVDASSYLTAAEKFWEFVIEHHTYVTGGNSEWEHFGADDVLDRERTNANCETCNTYNMLKLSRALFSITKEKKYLDYYENTYYNAILSSQNPQTGMTTYFQPMASGYFKVYSSAENHFWCCTGSGMESFTKLGDSIYYDAGGATYVSLYLASVYTSDKVTLTQTADLENSDSVQFVVDSGSTELRLRRPYWSETFSVQKNGEQVKDGGEDFVSVSVKKGDVVTVNLNKAVRAYNLPDGQNTYAFLYGPFVLSAELGTESMTTGTTGVNVTVPASAVGAGAYSVETADLGEYMNKIGERMQKGEDNKFTLATKNGTLTYSYHFRQHTQRYAIYTRFTTGEAIPEKPAYEWLRSDTVQPGYGQYENDSLHDMQENLTESETNVAGMGTFRYAKAGGAFTYRMIVKKGETNRLSVTLAKEDNGKTLCVRSGDRTLYAETLAYAGAADLYDVQIEIPSSLLEEAEEITYSDAGGNELTATVLPITFSGVDGAQSARVCSYIYSEYLENHTAYFVDCGDYDPGTVTAGDMLGKYNSVTEQIYGVDRVTGKSWGLIDNHATDIAGSARNGIKTNSTWAYEFNSGDGLDKTASNRYTKNQYENGVARNLHYAFELEDGTYTVKMYFSDPWGCSKNPCVKANGADKIVNGNTGEVLVFTVTVEGGELKLDISTSDLCINLCYIIILFGE